MLVVDSDEAALPTEVELPNGLAPPTANIRKRKWRKRPPPDEKRRPRRPRGGRSMRSRPLTTAGSTSSERAKTMSCCAA